MWYVYILGCKDGSLYTGVTDSLERRFNEHRKGRGGHYTGYNRPKSIVFFELFENKLAAQERERQIKAWNRAKKLALIRGDIKQLRLLSVSRD